MEYKKHLAKDPKFKKLLHLEINKPELHENIALRLVSSILSQQLSTKVARIIDQRFLDLFSGKKPTAKKILDMPLAKIRAIGISQSKANYIHNVAKFIVENKISDKKLHKMQDDEIIELLTEIKGVGRWTVEMLLIFSLGREDIFAVDDLGIQKGMQKLHSLDHLKGKDLKAQMVKLSQRWSPYRSFACLYLWKFQEK
jgi:DNA-3-methyladenine glycosylase II